MSEKMRERAEAGEVYKNPNEKPSPEPVYQQDEVVCVLTLDQKQAWVLMVLLGPYGEAEEGMWDIYLAAQDVRRRLAESLGYE